ncbi:hypothetical protein COH49_11980, partial [Neisseria meningitidis]
MDFFNFFEQGYFKKLAVENGLNTEYFIFQFIVCKRSVAETHLTRPTSDPGWVAARAGGWRTKRKK